MPLPETDREHYRRNPLAEVASLLRFPAILRIESEPPAQFQDAIRNAYPLYRQIMAAGQLPPDVPAPVRNLIQGIGAAAGPLQHVFEAQDKTWSIALWREGLVLKTTAYTRWEEFRNRTGRLRDTFVSLYRPASFTQIGLRYVDIVRRSVLFPPNDLPPWSELLKPQIAGELAAAEFGENIDSMSRQLHCALGGENCFLTLKTGIARAEAGVQDGVREKCFLIDSDFHTHRPTELANVTATLNTFNRAAGNLFRWAILPRLRQALQPQPLE